MIIVDGEQVTRLDKGKGRERDEPVTEALAAPMLNWHRVSLKTVGAQDMATEGGPTLPPPKKAKVKSTLARMTPTSAVAPKDQLWMTRDERPSPMCEACTTRGYPGCLTTGLQITCMACQAGKTKCSYSAARIARRDALIVSGELPGKNVAGRQRTQANEGSETKAKGGKAGNKRKWQGETTDDEPCAGNPGSAA
jgi:hypothetical protein